MLNFVRGNMALGVICIAFALFALLFWIPLDAESGLIQRIRRRLSVGDGLAPTIAAALILIGGLILSVFERGKPDQATLTWSHLAFIGSAIAILAVSLLTMRYAGPILVALLNAGSEEQREYRLLRDTAPWKHLGFALGGTFSIIGLMILTERRLGWQSVLIAILSVLALIAIYDLPFDDLLLPPNGDV